MLYQVRNPLLKGNTITSPISKSHKLRQQMMIS